MARSKSYSRSKGHTFERFIANVFKACGFKDAQRQLEYQANQAQGIDLMGTGAFRVQCKKTKTYVSINTINEVKVKDPSTEIPVLIAAGDNLKPMVTMGLDAFVLLLISNYDPNATLSEAQDIVKRVRKAAPNGEAT